MSYVWKEPTRTKFLRLSRPPQMSVAIKCDACLIDLEWDDGYECPSCGTIWGDVEDGEVGELASESGWYGPNRIEDDVTDNDYAYLRGDEVIRHMVWEKGVEQ